MVEPGRFELPPSQCKCGVLPVRRWPRRDGGTRTPVAGFGDRCLAAWRRPWVVDDACARLRPESSTSCGPCGGPAPHGPPPCAVHPYVEARGWTRRGDVRGSCRCSPCTVWPCRRRHAGVSGSCAGPGWRAVRRRAVPACAPRIRCPGGVLDGNEESRPRSRVAARRRLRVCASWEPPRTSERTRCRRAARRGAPGATSSASHRRTRGSPQVGEPGWLRKYVTSGWGRATRWCKRFSGRPSNGPAAAGVPAVPPRRAARHSQPLPLVHSQTLRGRTPGMPPTA